MTASRAYLAGLGTTGVLVGFALLMLAVVSAIVAFRGWPGDAVVDGAGAVTVGDGGRLVEIEPFRLGERARAEAAAAATGTAAAGSGASRAAGGRFGVGGVSRGGSAQLQPGSSVDAAPGLTGTPSVPPATTGGGGGVAGGVTQGAAGAVDEAVGQVGGVPGAGGGPVPSVPAIEGVQQKASELGLP